MPEPINDNWRENIRLVSLPERDKEMPEPTGEDWWEKY